MASDIIVRIGAAQDRSVDAVFTDIEKRARKAYEVTRRESSKATSDVQKNNHQQAASAKQDADRQLKVDRDMYREKSRLNRAIAVEQLRTERATTMAQMRMNRERTRDRLAAISQEEKAERDYQARLVRMQQASQREQTRSQRTAARERAREEFRQSREIDRFATRTSHRATRFFFPRPEGAIGYGKRVAGDLMRGAGIDFSLAGGVSRAKERETAGMGLAQQERIATGKTQGGAYWANKSLEVGTDLKTDPAQVTEMMRAFTGKTGDFAAAAEQAKELASMTMAAGANMGEMGSAAGFVYNQLKGMPGAAEMTLTVMRGIVGQTAVGAVEMEEYAKQMGRIAANAKMFEGGVDKNILELSALTQLSIAEGGATSGADAARSIAAFANTTSKGQRINAFKKHGVELFNESGTQKRPIMDIIKDSLVASKGNIPKMTQMWADTLGQKPIRAMANAYNAAGGGGLDGPGIAAAMAKVQPFMDAQMGKETERANIEEYNKTTAAKAADFQNKLDQITTSLSGKLLPALEQLAPKALELSNMFADAVAWAAGNPWETVMLLLGASVARAATESFGRMLLERMITGGVGVAGGIGGGVGSSLGGGIAGSAVAGVGGTLGAIAALVGVGAAAYLVTESLLKLHDAAREKDKRERGQNVNDLYFEAARNATGAENPLARVQAIEEGKRKIEAADRARGFTQGMSPEAKAAMKRLDSDEEERRLREFRQSGNAALAASVDPAYSKATKEGQGISDEQLGRVLAGALTGQTIQVSVRNFSEMPSFTPADGGGGASQLPTFFNGG